MGAELDACLQILDLGSLQCGMGPGFCAPRHRPDQPFLTVVLGALAAGVTWAPPPGRNQGSNLCGAQHVAARPASGLPPTCLPFCVQAAALTLSPGSGSLLVLLSWLVLVPRVAPHSLASGSLPGTLGCPQALRSCSYIPLRRPVSCARPRAPLP